MGSDIYAYGNGLSIFYGGLGKVNLRLIPNELRTFIMVLILLFYFI